MRLKRGVFVWLAVLVVLGAGLGGWQWRRVQARRAAPIDLESGRLVVRITSATMFQPPNSLMRTGIVLYVELFNVGGANVLADLSVEVTTDDGTKLAADLANPRVTVTLTSNGEAHALPLKDSLASLCYGRKLAHDEKFTGYVVCYAPLSTKQLVDRGTVFALTVRDMFGGTFIGRSNE